MTAHRFRICGLFIVTTVGVVFTVASPVRAEGPVGLGTATSFAVLAGQTVTNTGASVISGDVGLSPGSAVVGFPPGLVNNGTLHVTDAVAAQAQLDLTAAYDDAAGRTPVTPIGPDLSGLTLTTGVYSAGAMSLTGTLVLDGQNDPNASFVFQAASSLITGSSSVVSLINGANPCNVFWQVVSSATLGTGSTFVGTVMALTSISATTGANVTGRLLARNGAVTLDANVINAPTGCAVFAPPPTTTTTTTTIAATTTTVGAVPTSVVLPRTGASSATTEWAALFAIVAGGSTLLLLRRKPRRPTS
ncbi:MAG: ice-binding family protein [Ilumatobacteraceae bacterium]